MANLFPPFKALDESLALCGEEIYWKKRPGAHFKTARGANIFNSRYAGTKAGTLLGPKNAYRIVWITYGGVKYQILEHVAVWALFHREYPESDIDHEDGNGLNNNPSNLRLATHTENMHNKRMYRNNKSGHVGVKQHPDGVRWIAFGSHNGVKKTIGTFTKLLDADDARKSWEVGKGFSLRHGQPCDAQGVPVE